MPLASDHFSSERQRQRALQRWSDPAQVKAMSEKQKKSMLGNTNGNGNKGKKRSTLTAEEKRLRANESARKCREKNREKINEISRIKVRNKYRNDPEYRKKQQASAFMRKYGITIGEFEEIKIEQNNRCAICNEEKELVADHCHISGAFRGALCGHCNKGIGFLRDDPIRLQRALVYLSPVD